MNLGRRILVLSRDLFPCLVVVAFAALAIGFPTTAFAFVEDATGAPLPYEKGLGVFYTSMTGPVPFIISLMGIVACGAMLIFGGEISGFMRTMVFIVLVVAVIVQATSVVDMLGGSWEGKPPGSVMASPVPPDVKRLG